MSLSGGLSGDWADDHRFAVNTTDLPVAPEATVHTYEVDKTERPPTWSDAMARMEAEGRDAAY